jgi:hypothetical protein
METIFEGLNNAYIMFSAALGIWAIVLAGRDVVLSGNFWGAMWTNTGLAAVIFIVALIMTAQGLRPYGTPPGSEEQIRWVYYLYGIYFIISLPGLFALLGGSDNRRGRAGIWFGLVALFNAAAAYRAAYGLIEVWK